MFSRESKAFVASSEHYAMSAASIISRSPQLLWKAQAAFANSQKQQCFIFHQSVCFCEFGSRGTNSIASSTASNAQQEDLGFSILASERPIHHRKNLLDTPVESQKDRMTLDEVGSIAIQIAT